MTPDIPCEDELDDPETPEVVSAPTVPPAEAEIAPKDDPTLIDATPPVPELALADDWELVEPATAFVFVTLLAPWASAVAVALEPWETTGREGCGCTGENVDGFEVVGDVTGVNDDSGGCPGNKVDG